jgi:hypothetical protein
MKRIFIIATLALAACNGSPKNEAQHTEQPEESIPGTENASSYQYEPAVSSLKGTLSTQLFWGPPGYGEDTTTDEREKEYVLILDKAISMQKPDSDLSEGFNGALNHVTKIQLVHTQNLQPYLHKTVQVTGTLFGAQTGHHHTEVLLEVKSIK